MKRALWFAITVLLVWALSHFIYHTLWPSGPDAWTNGVDTADWWVGSTPQRAPVKPKQQKVTL